MLLMTMLEKMSSNNAIQIKNSKTIRKPEWYLTISKTEGTYECMK